MHALTFETFTRHPGNADAYQACLDAAHLRLGPGCPLFLTGPRGTGKTHLLWAIVEEVRRHSLGVALAFVRAGEFPEKVRRLAKQPGPIQQGRPCLLLVDDTESFEEDRDELERVVELFLQHGHTVVLSSELPLESLPRYSAWFHALLSNGRTLTVRPAEPGETPAVSESGAEEALPEAMEEPLPYPTTQRTERFNWTGGPEVSAILASQPDPALQAELEELREDRERLSGELEAVLRNVETLRVSAETQEKLNADIHTLRDEVARLGADREAVSAEREALRQALASEREGRERAETAFEASRQSFEATQAQLEEKIVHAATEAAELRRELAESRTKHDVLRRALSDTSSLDEVKVRYGETARMLNDQLDRLRDELRTTRQERTLFEHKVEQLAEMPAEIDRLRREAKTLRAERANLKAVLDDTTVLDQLKARHEETASMLRGQLDMLRMKLAEAREERETSERAHEERTAQAAERIAALRKELDESTAERQQLYEALSDTRAFDELREWHAETARYASDQMDILRSEVRRMREQHTSLEEELANTSARAQADRETAAEDLRGLQAECGRMAAALADTSAMDELRAWHAEGSGKASELVADANGERDRAIRELEWTQARLEEKAAQMERLKTELEEVLSDTSALDAMRGQHTEALKALNTQRAETAALRDERDALRQECQRLQRQSGELDSVKALLEQSLRVKVEEMAKFQSELLGLRRELIEARAEGDAARAAQERLQTRLAEKVSLEGALAEAEASRDKLLEAFESRTREWESLRQEQTAWERERERLLGRLAQAGARAGELAGAQAQLAATREDQARLEEELTRSNAEIGALKRERLRLEKRLAELEILAASLPQVDEERRGLRRETWDMAEQLAFVQAELGAVKEERERLRERGAAMERHVRELAEARRDLWRMAERLCALDEDRQALERGLSGARAALDAAQGLHAALGEVCSERDEARLLLWNMAERLDAIRTDMHSLLTEKSRLEHWLGLAQDWAGPQVETLNERERLQTEINHLLGAVEHARRNAEEANRVREEAAALDAARLDIEAKQCEAQAGIQALHETIRTLSGELADVQAEVRLAESDQARLQELLQATDSLKAKLEEAEAEEVTLQEVLGRLRAQLEAAREERATAQEEHERLQTALRAHIEMEQTLEELETARNNGRDEMAWLREELKSCAAALEESQANHEQVARLLDEKAGVAQALEAMRAECDSLREQSKTAYDEIARHRELMQAAVAEHARLQTLVDEKNALEEQARAAESERVRLMEDAAELGERLDRLRAEIRAHEARQASLREVLAAKDAAELHLNEAQAARERIRYDIEQLREQLKTAEAEDASLQAGIAQLDAMLALKEDLDRQVRAMDVENDADRKLLQGLAQEVETRLDAVHAGQAAFAYAGQETLSALEQFGIRLRARAEGPGSGRVPELEKELQQAKAVRDTAQRQAAEFRQRQQDEQQAWESERQRMAEQVESAELRNRQLQDALAAAHTQLQAGEHALEMARAQFGARAAEMARQMARLEAALRNAPQGTAPVPAIETNPPGGPRHPMETRLANFFEIERDE